MPLFGKLLSQPQRLKLERLNRISKYGSPPYTINFPVTIAGAYVEYNIATTFPAAKKYEPLDTLEVVNSGGVALQVNINGSGGEQMHVPANSVRTVKDTPIWQLRVTNLDAAIATVLGLVRISLRRAPLDADTVARGSNL
jgi:hypothetical protein